MRGCGADEAFRFRADFRAWVRADRATLRVVDLEELLIREGVAAPRERIRAVVRAADRNEEHCAAALVDQGVVTEDVLVEILARAAGAVVADPNDPALFPRPDLASADIARRHLFCPVGANRPGGDGGESVRVVFANPLDLTAMAAARTLSGLQVLPMVATVNDLRRLLDRAFPAAGAPGEPDAVTKDTSPLHHLEGEATMAQRHEALLLALVERGLITHADYAASLKRLLSGARSR